MRRGVVFIGGCIAGCVTVGSIAFAQLNAAEGFTWAGALADPITWFMRAPNPWLLINTAISTALGVLGGWAAIAELRTKRGYSEEQGQRDRAHQSSMFEALDDRAQHGFVRVETGIDEVRERIARNQHEQTLIDIRKGTCTAEELDALHAALREAAQGGARTTSEGAERYADTIVALAQSSSASDRDIALTATGGDPVAAADALVQAGYADKARNAERFRQAARLYAPFAPAKALGALAEAVELDPTYAWSWLELGRLRAHYDSIDSARRCFEMALQHISDEHDRCALDIALGDLAYTTNDLAEARKHYEAALAISERLAKAEPRSVERSVDLTTCHNKLGTIEIRSENRAAARQHYEVALAIRERQASLEPRNIQRQRDLMVSYEGLGNLEAASGNLEAARSRFGAGIAICERLVQHEPRQMEWRRDLAVNYERLGNVEVAARDFGAARARYEAALAIRKWLTAGDSRNTQWQRDLSVNYEKLGDVEWLARDPAAAGKWHAAALAIRERLAAQEPDNFEWQRDLYVSLGRMALVAEVEGARKTAIAGFERAEEIMKGVVAGVGENAQFANDLLYIRTQLARLRE